MITRNEAENIAAAIHQVRRDWPTASLLTLIIRDLADWPYLDVLVGLAHVAGERNLDGTWLSQTPARVKENGPWRRIEGLNGDAEHTRRQAAERRAQQRAEQETRWLDIDHCDHCDPYGYLPSGNLCLHVDPQLLTARARRGAATARAALTARTSGTTDPALVPGRQRTNEIIQAMTPEDAA